MFGYNFRKDCWGFGYATEAVKAMIQFAKEQFGITRFCSSHVEPNKASGHVMEKCGLHFVRYGEFQKLDGTCKMRSMEYETDKKVIFLGSSVTYGSAAGGISFADYISERNGLTMVKEAVSGTTLVDMDNQSYVSRLKALDVSECDLFVCQLSTNDASQKLPIGDIEAALVEIIDYVKINGIVRAF